MTAGAVAAMNSEPEAKRARIEPENQEKETVLQKKNLIEIDGKSCTHEVAWPPGKGLSPSFYLFSDCLTLLYISIPKEAWQKTGRKNRQKLIIYRLAS